jgi:hypothetical protein
MQPMPSDAVDRLAKHAAPPLANIGVDPVHGWVGGRHLLDVPITEENATFGGYLRVVLMKAERKVPSSLLRAECMLEEFAHMKAEGKPFVDRKTRSQIRKQIMARLLPEMPPTLKGVPFVHDPDANMVFVGATTDKQMDAFSVNFRSTIGLDPIPLNAGTAAAQRHGIDVRGWQKTSFSPEVPDADMEDTPGQDFLTWLWFASEARGGIFKTDDNGEVGVTVEGPLTLQRTGDGAHEAALRNGLPTASAEAKTALLSGKKLRRAKLLLGRTDETWSSSFDADTFVFRGLKLPEAEGLLDPASRFQDRILKLGTFRELFLTLYDRFVEDRSSPAKWEATKREIHQWATERSSRK